MSQSTTHVDVNRALAGLLDKYAVEVIGRTEAVKERYYAISAERRLKHPAVLAITDVARSLMPA